MKRVAGTAMATAMAGVLWLAPVFGQGGAPAQPPATNTVATAIPGVVAGGTTVQFIKEGFQGAEGPVGLPDGSVIFTATGGKQIMRIDQKDQVTTYLNFASSGLGFDPKGRLIATSREEGKDGVVVLSAKGVEAVLADRTTDPGLSFVNDLVVDRKGGVYYTDPNNARVTYITPGGKIVRVAEGITRTNGLILSPDDRVLYVNDSRGEFMVAYDVQADGTLRNRRNFGKYDQTQPEKEGPYKLRSGADGMTVDSEGRVYNTEFGGVFVYSPAGTVLGKIPVSRRPQNVAFAGPDKKTLYIVGSGAAWKVRLLAQGLRDRAK